MPRFNSLSLGFLTDRPRAAARVLQSQPPQDTVTFLGDVPLRILAPVLAAMETWPAARLLHNMPTERAAGILATLDYREAVALLRLQEEPRQTSLLAALPERLSRPMKKTLAYPDNRVGALMDMSVPYFQHDLSAGDCLALLRGSEEAFGTTLTAVDSNRKIVGVVSLDRLLVSPAECALAQLADTSVAVLSPEMSLHHALSTSSWHRHTQLPVAGRGHSYLGSLSRQALDEALARDRREAIIDTSFAGHLARAMLVAVTGLVQPLAMGPHRQGGEQDNDL